MFYPIIRCALLKTLPLLGIIVGCTDNQQELPELPKGEPGCIIADGDSLQADFTQHYIRRSFDPDTRIVTYNYFYVEDGDTIGFQTVYNRLDAQGLLLAYQKVDDDDSGPIRRRDFTRDSSGNVTRFEIISGEEVTDLTEPSGIEPSEFYEYEHTFNAEGRLIESTFVDGEPAEADHVEYTHDKDGRCEAIVSTYVDSFYDLAKTDETRAYENGRISKKIIDITDVNGTSMQIVTVYKYDDQGRLIAEEQDGGGHWSFSADGTVDLLIYWKYYPDGATLVEYRDYTTDVPNDEVEVDGEIRSVGRSFEVWSQECAAQDAQIPKNTSTACIFDTASYFQEDRLGPGY